MKLSHRRIESFLFNGVGQNAYIFFWILIIKKKAKTFATILLVHYSLGVQDNISQGEHFIFLRILFDPMNSTSPINIQNHVSVTLSTWSRNSSYLIGRTSLKQITKKQFTANLQSNRANCWSIRPFPYIADMCQISSDCGFYGCLQCLFLDKLPRRNGILHFRVTTCSHDYVNPVHTDHRKQICTTKGALFISIFLEVSTKKWPSEAGCQKNRIYASLLRYFFMRKSKNSPDTPKNRCRFLKSYLDVDA